MDAQQRKQLGDTVKARRDELGWSQAKLATQAGVSENTVLSIENPKPNARGPQEAKQRAVLDALGMVSPSDGVLDLEGVPEAGVLFIRVVVKRFAAMEDPAKLDRVLARLYPILIQDD